MAQANKTSGDNPSLADLASDARGLMRRALKASVATLDPGTGYPYASLIIVANDASGAPSLLISNLARHTRNLVNDNRASILVDGTGATGDPLQGARVTLFGLAEKTDDPSVRRRFLARHPEAEFYASFPDFSVWRLKVEGAHYIDGFGRIVDLKPENLLIDATGAEPLLAAETDILEHMNADHADAVELYATVLKGARAGPWRMVGIDPEGCDLLLDSEALRILFAKPIATPNDAREELVRLTKEAREQQSLTA
jgi:putative heme iron utilization protein